MIEERAATTDELLAEVVREAAGGWTSCPLDHRVENMTTRALERRQGRTADGRAWSVVVKTLQPASDHPAFATIPAAFHGQVLEDLDWRDEPHVYGCGLGAELPPPLRMPAVVPVAAGEAVALWMEDVDDVAPWDLDRYRRTAEALGALAGRWSAEDATARFDLHGRDIGRLFSGKILNDDVPALADDAFWADPALRAVVDADHRRDLHRLADVVPILLAAVEPGPRGVCHGDATPDNFREPGDGSIVALDWSYGHVGHVGTDLAQLVAGRFESGAAADLDVAEVAEVAVAAHLEGLDRVGRVADPEIVRRAFALHLAIRSAFSALRLDHRTDLDPDQRADLLAVRAPLGRYAVDLALSFA